MRRISLGMAALLVAVLMVGAAENRPLGVSLVGVATIPGDATDFSGLEETLGDGVPHNRLGGIGSGIAFTGEGNRYVLVADRGSSDGIVPFQCRFHEAEIVVAPGASPTVAFKLTGTTLLRDDGNAALIGCASAIASAAGMRRFDPEGVRVAPAGSLYVADEYGPSIAEFSRAGQLLRNFELPAKFAIERPHADPKKELALNGSGRMPNRGLEGLAITPAGDGLVAVMQGPLIQDGGRKGMNARIVAIDVAGGPAREWVYPLDKPEYGLSEILAVNDRQFLVIEREGKAGNQAAFKKIMLIDAADATDVSSIASLPVQGLPPGVRPVQKRDFIDLLDPRFGLRGSTFPAKIEGLAFGPDLPDGRRLLLVVSDNDFKATEPTYVYAFAIEREALPGFVRQAARR